MEMLDTHSRVHIYLPASGPEGVHEFEMDRGEGIIGQGYHGNAGFSQGGSRDVWFVAIIVSLCRSFVHVQIRICAAISQHACMLDVKTPQCQKIDTPTSLQHVREGVVTMTSATAQDADH